MVKENSFEEMVAEVENIIDQLHTDKLPLDQVVERVERAHQLIVMLRDKINTVGLKIENIRNTLRSKLEEEND